MTKKINATVEETKDSLYSVKISVNGHQLIGDEPESYGSKNLGPAPYDLLLAALGECTAMTVRWMALQKKWPLEKVEVHLTHEKKDKIDVFTKKTIIHGEKLTNEQRQKLQEATSKCPVHQTLMSNVVIESSVD